MQLFDYSKNDIDYQTAYNAHRHTSMSPDKRAQQTQDGYVQFMDNINDEFNKFVTDENIDSIKDDLTFFKMGYIERKNKHLYAKSRCASAMITGPSNFNTRRNNKNNDTEHKRLTELIEWSEKTLGKLRRKYNPKLVQIIRSDDTDAIGKLKVQIEKLEKWQVLMKAANKICKSKKLDDAVKVNKLVELGLTPEQAGELIKPDFIGKIGFSPYQLQNNNANIRTKKKRLVDLEREEAKPEAEEVTGNGWILRENKDVQRIQFIFNSKLVSEVRKKLNEYAFNYAPSWEDKPWQRLLNRNGRYAADKIIKWLNEQEAILE